MRKPEKKEAVAARVAAFAKRQKEKGHLRFTRWVSPEEKAVLELTYKRLIKKRN